MNAVGSTNAVELEGVTKRFGQHVAVDRLDLAVPEGTVYGFIGPNGSGKTTTLRMILRILYPESGRVTVLGRGERERGRRPRGLPARGTRAVQTHEGPRPADLLRPAQGLSELPPRNRRVARTLRARPVGRRSESRHSRRAWPRRCSSSRPWSPGRGCWSSTSRSRASIR